MKRCLKNKSLYRLPFIFIKCLDLPQRENSALTLMSNFGKAEDVFAQRPWSPSHALGCHGVTGQLLPSLFRKVAMGTKNGGTLQEPENEIFFKQLMGSLLH